MQRLLSRTPSPEAAALNNETAEHLKQAVLALPPQYRVVLVLHDMEDLSTSEVAQVLGIREGTVRVRLHRARLFVRQKLSRIVPRGDTDLESKPVPSRLGRSAVAVCLPRSPITWMGWWMTRCVRRWTGTSAIAHPARHFYPACNRPWPSADPIHPAASHHERKTFAGNWC